MGFYDTIAITFIITLIGLWILRRFYSKDSTSFRNKLLTVLGFGVIACVIYYLVQLILGLNPLVQNIDIAGIILGALAALGLTQAWEALRERYMPKT